VSTFVGNYVEGYVFMPGEGNDLSERNRTICRVIGRAEPEYDGLDPKFLVVFGDGFRTEAYYWELRPWYPT